MELPAVSPASSLDELRYRVDGLQRLALDGQAKGLLDQTTARTLFAQAGALLVAGAGGRGGADGPQLPALPETRGGEGDRLNPALVPMEWAFDSATLDARNQRPIPGLPSPYTGSAPTELLGQHLMRNWHFLSDQSWRELTSWMADRRIADSERWRWIYDKPDRAKTMARA